MPSRLADVYRTHPTHLQHNHLDFESVHEVPESHAWPPLDDYPSRDSYGTTTESVPVIDLSDPKAVRLMGHACKTWGVFQVTNHGIPMRLLNDVESESRRLFSLPVPQKLKAARLPDGISGYGIARISSFFPKRMWSEGFTILGSPSEHARQLWPKDFNNFCDVMEEYEKEMKQLAGRLLWLILGSLDINKEDIKWAGPKGDFADAGAVLQLNSYPACPEPNRAMGLAAHTDSTLLTVLYQNSTSGLQVLRDGAGWVMVPPLAGALVINIGDLLHILSNGRYPSVLHRAVVNSTHHRLSIAYLYGPPMNVQISPLSRLIDPYHPPLYRSVTWSEYLRAKAQHFNKALSSVRLWSPLNGYVDVNSKNSVKVG
ncbi:gibberellin 3-beta-dioxygenase 1-like [Macadamia integrifolia]|uniref:gibberellin 3-beta-dioxygenase 1-like n=1 Tax=Macadamia integrifolia TaxID=60698 RepID=UPI001C4E9BC0|nr:gibberellin 3-beta-dioxygenase 1-like [Macadamia integrifolia]